MKRILTYDFCLIIWNFFHYNIGDNSVLIYWNILEYIEYCVDSIPPSVNMDIIEIVTGHVSTLGQHYRKFLRKPSELGNLNETFIEFGNVFILRQSDSFYKTSILPGLALFSLSALIRNLFMPLGPLITISYKINHI